MKPEEVMKMIESGERVDVSQGYQVYVDNGNKTPVTKKHSFEMRGEHLTFDFRVRTNDSEKGGFFQEFQLIHFEALAQMEADGVFSKLLAECKTRQSQEIQSAN